MEAGASNSSPISTVSIDHDGKSDLDGDQVEEHTQHSSKLQPAAGKIMSLAGDRHKQSVVAVDPYPTMTPVDSMAEAVVAQAGLACSRLATEALKSDQYDASCSSRLAEASGDVQAKTAATEEADATLAVPAVSDRAEGAAPSQGASPADAQVSALGYGRMTAELDGRPGVRDVASPCQQTSGQPQGTMLSPAQPA